MFGWIGKLGAREPASKPHAERLVYAIGDVHGRLDLLEPLIEKILQDVVATVPPDAPPPDMILMGDMIDRGPDSRGVMEFLESVNTWPEVRTVMLMGNHEAMLLDFLKDPIANKRWLRYGGYETLISYQLGMVGDLFDDDNLVTVAARLAEAMGSHIELLLQCVPSRLNGNLFFTHAGAMPDVHPDDQPLEAMIWGDPGFLRKQRRDGLWVVHGHTVVPEPEVKKSRIAIDTGAYLSGALTALKADGQALSFLRQTSPDRAPAT